MPVSETVIRIGVWLVALFCALTGIATIFYGFIAIYSLSGFTSIFIGVVIVIISVGLLKRHAIARVGALIILILSSTGCAMWLFFFQYNTDVQQKSLGQLEYFCLIYIVFSVIAILFLSIKKTKSYFSVYAKQA
jgi:hypothetical protein